MDANCRPREISWGKGVLGEHTGTYKEIHRVLTDSTRRGYFCHDEMFVWANDLMDQVPRIREWLRRRFPVLFLDEVQDNSEIQSTLLRNVFMEGANPVIRQRFGDSNQAIYEDIGGTRPQTDKFPNTAVRISVENSYRFDQSIAELVDPLGVVPQGLRGLRQMGTARATDMRRIACDFSI